MSRVTEIHAPVANRLIAVAIVALLTAVSVEAQAGASYQGASYQGASYQGASYQGASYQGASYQGASYQGASYQGASYQGASYQGASYQGASYQGPRSRDGWLEGEHLIGTITDRQTGRAALLRITDFAGDVVRGAVFAAASGKTRAVELRPTELIGMHWVSYACSPGLECAYITYRVTGARRDDTSNTMVIHSDNSDVWLYDIQYSIETGPGADNWASVCPDGSIVLFVNGRWSPDGSWSRDGYTASCPRGVIAKCVRSWGYRPWKTLDSPEYGPVSLGDLHRACVRAARADYCGDGSSHTRDGTLIDISDRYGFNIPESIPGFRDESVFGVNGALSVSAPRWPTAARDAGDWVFPTCRRPSQARSESGLDALLTVRSQERGRLGSYTSCAMSLKPSASGGAVCQLRQNSKQRLCEQAQVHELVLLHL